MVEILKSQGRSINSRVIQRAAQALIEGRVIVVPTETGYCFAGHSGIQGNHKTLLELRKAHPKNKPFSILCKDAKQVAAISELSTASYRILNKLLPGPFTVILPATRFTPKNVMGSFKNTVGVRITSHPITTSLMAELDFPLIVTSVTDAEELQDEGYLDDTYMDSLERWWTTAEGILSHTPKGLHLLIAGEEPLPMKMSTILDLSQEGHCTVLRDGGWTPEGLLESL